MGDRLVTAVGNLEMIADLNQRLCDAVWKEDLDEFKELLLLGAQVECVDRSGNTPLHLAIEQTNFEMVQLLLDKGADVNARTADGYWTPLIHCAEVVCDAAHQTRRPFENRLLKLLIERGADVMALSSEGDSALHFAQKAANTEGVQMLLEAMKR